MIRCSHNPYSEQFTKIADRVGMLIVDELIDKWSDKEYWGGREPFTSYWYKLIPEWIKRDRNSPSVILWSLGNELQNRDAWAGFPTEDWGVTTYRIFDTLVKRYDATRKTTVAMFPSRAGGIYRDRPEYETYLVPPELACETEVASFNYRWKAYPGYLEHAPHLIIFQSEATTRELLGPYYGMDQDKMVGLAYWGAVEYWGESDGWPTCFPATMTSSPSTRRTTRTTWTGAAMTGSPSGRTAALSSDLTPTASRTVRRSSKRRSSPGSGTSSRRPGTPGIPSSSFTAPWSAKRRTSGRTISISRYRSAGSTWTSSRNTASMPCSRATATRIMPVSARGSVSTRPARWAAPWGAPGPATMSSG